MTLLPNGLPYEIDGVEIMPDYRNMIAVEQILQDEEMSEAEKTAAALGMLYPRVPADVGKAIEGLGWFYACGETQPVEEGAEAPKQHAPAYDFAQDAGLLYAAFYQVYGISLTTVEFLHWWEFCALFAALPDEVLMRRVMYWRTVELREVPKYEKDFVRKMKQAYALKRKGEARRSLAEMEQMNVDWAQRRYEEAQRRMEAERERLDYL